MISILVICPNPTDATSFYRGVRPLAALKLSMANLNLVYASQTDWTVLSMVDAVFLQRPFNGNHLAVARMAVEWKVPLWVDYDDDLFEVPQDNPAYAIYSKEEIQKNVAEICAMAKVVTVSTQALRRKLAPLNPDIVVVPNAWDEKLLTDRNERNLDANPLVLWRGSATHQRDILVHGEAIIELSKKHPNWTWHFQGYNPWFVTERMDPGKVVTAPSVPVEKYFQFIRTIRPKLVITPLADNAFNRSKSNIAWIEATYAGAACLAPLWEEWMQPGVVGYSSKADFADKLDLLMSGSIDTEARLAESWEFIKTNRLTVHSNRIRAGVLERVINTGKKLIYA